MKKEILEILACPNCQNEVKFENPYFVCTECKKRFPLVDGNIALFFTNEDLKNFSNEPWGKELIKEGYGKFLTNEEPINNLKKVARSAIAAGIEKRDRGEVYRPLEDEKLHKAVDIISKDKLIELTRANEAELILDWPTGMGFFLSTLLEKVLDKALVVCNDINFEWLATTKGYFENHPLKKNLFFVVSDSRKMPFKNGGFGAVTSWGGTSEIPNAQKAAEESFRVLKRGCFFGLTGDQYKENSSSHNLSTKLALDSLITERNLKTELKRIGFKDIQYKVLYEGYDTDLDTPDEERCPLPARGDYFSHIVASGKRK